jgi:voltage-gated potassium channel Kch
MFAAAFMYLDVSDQAQGLDTNVLFLLGGAAFYTASQVLTDVLEDLEREKRSFGVKASFSRGENIIAALNAQSRSPNFSRAVVNDIKLTSSFKF